MFAKAFVFVAMALLLPVVEAVITKSRPSKISLDPNNLPHMKAKKRIGDV